MKITLSYFRSSPLVVVGFVTAALFLLSSGNVWADAKSDHQAAQKTLEEKEAARDVAFDEKNAALKSIQDIKKGVGVGVSREQLKRLQTAEENADEADAQYKLAIKQEKAAGVAYRNDKDAESVNIAAQRVQSQRANDVKAALKERDDARQSIQYSENVTRKQLDRLKKAEKNLQQAEAKLKSAKQYANNTANDAYLAEIEKNKKKKNAPKNAVSKTNVSVGFGGMNYGGLTKVEKLSIARTIAGGFPANQIGSSEDENAPYVSIGMIIEARMINAGIRDFIERFPFSEGIKIFGEIGDPDFTTREVFSFSATQKEVVDRELNLKWLTLGLGNEHELSKSWYGSYGLGLSYYQAKVDFERRAIENGQVLNSESLSKTSNGITPVLKAALRFDPTPNEQGGWSGGIEGSYYHKIAFDDPLLNEEFSDNAWSLGAFVQYGFK